MNDNEIIKALECCSTSSAVQCHDCPYCGNNYEKHCAFVLAKDALDLINRQQAEKKALIAGQETMSKYIEEQQAEIERLLKIAKKMHTWIFLNSYDEDETYKECGLTDEENAMLGYGGKIILEDKEMVGDAE